MIGKFYRIFIYRHLMRLSHKFGWHYMRTIGPIDGATLVRCDWCGVGQWQHPREDLPTFQESSGPYRVK